MRGRSNRLSLFAFHLPREEAVRLCLDIDRARCSSSESIWKAKIPLIFLPSEA